MKRVIMNKSQVLAVGVIISSICLIAASHAAPAVVGTMGHEQALMFQGNDSFTKDKILAGMRWHLDYHLAAHSSAPLADFMAMLEHKITLGYQRAGFPNPIVHVTSEPNTNRITVKITEGLRFKCGDILLSGTVAISNNSVRQKINHVLAGWDGRVPQLTNMNIPIWSRNQPAPFDEDSLHRLTDLVYQALADLNYLRPKLNVRIIPDPAHNLAELKVELVDEGTRGTIEKIEVTGLRANTPQQVMDFLKLRAGMELNANLLNNVSNELWQSARFYQHNILLSPLPEIGKFKLELALEELFDASPLNVDFSPLEKALLNFRNWLLDWPNRPEDAVLSVKGAFAGRDFQGELVVSPSSGVAMLARIASSNGPPRLCYAMVGSVEVAGLYSLLRERKLVGRREIGGLGLRAFAAVAANPVPGGEQRFNIAVGGGNTTDKSKLFDLDLNFVPVAFVQLAHRAKANFSLKDGAVSIRVDPTEIIVDVATGRLIQLTATHEEESIRLRFEEGAFARSLREIAARSGDHRNDFLPKHGFSSFLAFIAADLVDAWPLHNLLLEDLAKTKRTNLLATVQRFKPFTARIREMVHSQELVEILEPLGRLSGKEQSEDDDPFVVPVDRAYANANANMMALAGMWILGLTDQLLPHNSWPWVLLRETAFNLAGQGKYFRAEMDRLLKCDDIGPLGCLTTAYLAGKIDPTLARSFADLGLSRLTVSDFQKDYRALFERDSILSQLAANVLGFLASFSEEQLVAVTATLAREEAAFIEHAWRSIRMGKDNPAHLAWPAVEQSWDSAVKPYLELGLSRFLPKVHFTTNSTDLYERGLALISSNSRVQNFDEAAECFAKAAAQEHAGAQMYLGNFYESGKGVPQDFAQAMHWYLKAAQQKEAHAACRVADLYRDGKGVRANPSEAAKWYRIEADGPCLGARFNLGRICEKQDNMAEALRWYRGAAEGGHVEAQAYLGNFLSDGFMVPADYPEACQWLMLAARAGHKVSEVMLRRVQTKITSEELERVRDRAAAIERRFKQSQSP
jgi:TPR repeat protein